MYKVAADLPLEIDVLGLMTIEDEGHNIQLTEKFQKASTRLDLQGITLNCGLVVSIQVLENS